MVEVGQTAGWYAAGAATTTDDDVDLFGDGHGARRYKEKDRLGMVEAIAVQVERGVQGPLYTAISNASNELMTTAMQVCSIATPYPARQRHKK